jgi:hypothetical protein
MPLKKIYKREITNNTMKKKSKINILILLALILVVMTILLITSLNKYNEVPSPSNTACVYDSDCVPAQCCHPDSCINKDYKSVCNLMCTAICSGPLDCSAGSCGCVKGECSVISSK